MSNLIAIVGRPNVGKSTLFNRLTESMDAITHDEAGVTRDRHYGMGEWIGRPFSVIDTGGYVHGSEDIFESEIRKQVKLAVEEADIILFVVDAREGLNEYDKDIAQLLRNSNKKVFLVVNKVDSTKLLNDATEFYALGLGEYYCIASASGSGTGELLDAVVAVFKPDANEIEPLPKITIVGQPNVGKSSLLNMLTGLDRSIVTPIAGTTRDSINIRYSNFGFDFYLVDTAGLRKKAKVHEDLEFYSVMRSIRAIEQSDVCLFMIDAEKGFTAQDANIFHLIQTNHKGVVILVNKWDLVNKDETNTKKFIEDIHATIAPLTDVPILFTSVTNKQRIYKALETAIDVYKNRTQHIPTSQLNKKILPYIESYPPPSVKGKLINIKYITQVPGPYPRFVFFSSNPQYIQTTYRRYLENKLRENFTLSGVPVAVTFRSKDSGKENA
jgi:GTP-binding protein